MAASLLSSTDRALQAMAMTSSGGALTVSGAAAERSGGRMLLQGATGFGMGVIHGAVGLVHEPYMGARRRGARGFAVGVGKGLAGAVIRPTAGVLQLTNNMAGAWVAMTHGLTGGEGGLRFLVGAALSLCPAVCGAGEVILALHPQAR